MGKLLALIVVLVLAACTQAKAPVTTTPSDRSAGPEITMTRIAKAMHACWFKKKDPRFRKFRMAPEITSYSGKPRILIVPRNNPGGLPKLVVQAQRVSGRTKVTSFGPLVDASNGPKLVRTVNAWSGGSTSCT